MIFSVPLQDFPVPTVVGSKGASSSKLLVYSNLSSSSEEETENESEVGERVTSAALEKGGEDDIDHLL